MADHERHGRPLLIGECQELPCKLAQHIPVERHKVCHPETEEDREQQQRVFGRLSQRLSVFDQRRRSLHCGLGFRRGIALDLQEGGV